MINGFEIQASFSQETVTNTLTPLLVKLAAMQHNRNGRLIVFLAGPPACGKSTLAAFLALLFRQYGASEAIQVVGIDGFHYHQDYILTHTVRHNNAEVPMKDLKGCPESYDVDKLYAAVLALKERNIKWPFYDRRLHDVVKDAIVVDAQIVLIEGNWLLLSEGKWRDLQALCDYSIMLRSDESALESRLIQRKIRGGLSSHEAVQFYRNSDKLNVARCLNNSTSADLTLRLSPDGHIE